MSALLRCLLGLLALVACSSRAVPRYEDAFDATAGPIVVVGDLQRTSKLEFWREQNDVERARIVAAIAAERPALIVVVGDLVFHGGAASHWERFDALVAAWRERNIPVLIVLGNHEYWLNRDGGAAHVARRFPALATCSWYRRRFGDLELVFLDTNHGPLPKERWSEQLTWLERTLRDVDNENRDEVRGAIVFGHHPPFSNAPHSLADERVANDVLPRLLQSNKTLALFSGHAHTYERFVVSGRQLVVTGGGGGPRVKLKAPDPDLPADRYIDRPGEERRPFHYVVLRPHNDGVAAVVRGFQKGEALDEIDRFELPFPPRSRDR